MDICFDNRGIGAQLLAIFQTVVDGCFNDSVIEPFHCGSNQPVEGLIEGVVSGRSEEHTSELQSPCNLVCRLLLEKKKKKRMNNDIKIRVRIVSRLLHHS